MMRLSIVLAALAMPASAAGPAWVPLPGVECYCTDARGARVELGQETCLSVGGRAFMARCAMSQNVPIWRDAGRDCVMG